MPPEAKKRSAAQPSPNVRELGELESAVLEVLWCSTGALSVREVGDALRRRPALAYTTIMTVLDRLHAKAIVSRVKQGRAFLYSPAIDRAAWIGGRAAVALSAEGAPPPAALMAFLDGVEARDPALLDRLAELIAARRGS